MPWVLDTNSWIFHLKQPGGPIERRLSSINRSEIFLCSIVKAELWHGAQKYGRPDRRMAALQNLFQPFGSFPFDDSAAAQYASIRHDLETRSIVIGPNDLKIAAICIARGVTLVTSNTAEYSRVIGLAIEDWNHP